MFTVPTNDLRVIARVHPVHAMNAEQCQTAADLWTKLTDLNRQLGPKVGSRLALDLSHRPACRQLGNYIHHRYLLSLSPKADTHFTIPQRVEG